MHGHDAYLVAGLVKLTFDLKIVQREPFDEAGQRRRLGCFVVYRLIQQGVDAFSRLAAKPRDQLFASFVDPQNPLQNLVGQGDVRTILQVLEHSNDIGMLFFVFEQKAVQAFFFPVRGELVKVAFS